MQPKLPESAKTPPTSGGLGSSASATAGGASARRQDAVHQCVHVPFEYPVVFTRGAFDPDNPALVDAVCRREPRRLHRLHLIIDSGVDRAWPDLASRAYAYVAAHPEKLALVDAPDVVQGGEACKNDPALVQTLQHRFHELGLDRQSLVVAVGGGAMLDLVGYAAATVHRGVRLLRMPTTVLAQNDSGVGVKNGVNAFGIKNFLGTFAPPFAVLNDRDFLDTLEPRDRVAGMAEAVKVGLIRDAAFFEWLEAQADSLRAFEPQPVDWMVRRSAELHLHHIASCGDPFEMGSARPLDFGHWAAHKLESLSGHRIRHGEAVAIGMALDARYSVEAGLLDEPSLQRIVALLEALGLPLWDATLDQQDPAGTPRVLEGLNEFREHLGGELTITLLHALGRGVETHEVSTSRVASALEWLRARAGSTLPACS